MQWSRPVPSLQPEEALGRALAGEERPVALVDVGGDQLRALGVGAGDEHGRHAAGVGGQARGVRLRIAAWVGISTLPPRWPHFFSRRQLVLEMDAGDARLDIGLHDLEAVQRPAEAGLGVGDDRREPVALARRPRRCSIWSARCSVRLIRRASSGPGVGRIERLVGIHGAGGVGVGRRLPAGQIDGVEPGADHLHRLVAGHRAQRPHRLVALQQFPQPERAAPRQAMLDRDRAAQAQRRRRRCTAARFRRSGRAGPGSDWSKLVMRLCSAANWLWSSEQFNMRACGAHRQKEWLCHNLTCACLGEIDSLAIMSSQALPRPPPPPPAPRP